MATYIWVGNFTEQGMRTIKDTTKRADAVREAGKKYGVTLKDMYWTMGQYDLVGIFEAKDDASISAFALTVGMSGNLQGQSMRAFNKDEMTAILGKVG
ncbi:MAG: GYD family protein [Betaproteobacteria bacterium SG8_39]|nr:MAG: GYD family protein [Betaproteobacteria bacterium SG8_39]